jgi:hypothetical protein
MTQTIRTVNELILSAFQLIGEYGPEEPISGADFQTGFELINLIIDGYSGTDKYIALTKTLEFDLIPNQPSYIISNVPTVPYDVFANRLASIPYMMVELQGQWRRPVVEVTRTQVYTRNIDYSIIGIPSAFLLENSEEYSKITLFNTPDSNYKCFIEGKFYLNKFEKFQPIRNVPLNYQRFLIYELGQTLLQYYPSGNWGPQTTAIHQQLKDSVVNSNDIDLKVRPTSLLSYPSQLGYFNNGYFPFWGS